MKMQPQTMPTMTSTPTRVMAASKLVQIGQNAGN